MHDQMIDGASGATEHRAKGRTRSLAVLLAAVVAMVTIVAGVSSPAGATPPNSNPSAVNVTVTGLVQSAAVTWNGPADITNVTGYLVTTNSAGTTAADTPTPAQIPAPVAVPGVASRTVTITGLTAGKAYSFTVQSLGTASETNGPGVTTVAVIANAAATPTFSAYAFASADAAITRHYQEFLQRDPNLSELVFWRVYFKNLQSVNDKCTGSIPVQNLLSTAVTSAQGPFCATNLGIDSAEYGLISFLIFGDSNAFDSGGYAGNDTGANTFAGVAEPVARLYAAFFQRGPDFGGLKFWINQYRHARSLSNIASFFAASTEFQRTYGSLSDADFVSLVYNNVLARVSDFGGQNYWRGQLEAGRSRGFVMTRFSESNEYKRQSNYTVKTSTLYAALLGRVPTKAELDATVVALNNQWTIPDSCFNLVPNPPGGFDVYARNTSTIIFHWSAGTCNDLKNPSAAQQALLPSSISGMPIRALLSSLRTSPAYTAAVAKPVALLS